MLARKRLDSGSGCGTDAGRTLEPAQLHGSPAIVLESEQPGVWRRSAAAMASSRAWYSVGAFSLALRARRPRSWPRCAAGSRHWSPAVLHDLLQAPDGMTPVQLSDGRRVLHCPHPAEPSGDHSRGRRGAGASRCPIICRAKAFCSTLIVRPAAVVVERFMPLARDIGHPIDFRQRHEGYLSCGELPMYLLPAPDPMTSAATS